MGQADGKRGVILATPATGSMARRRPATMYNSRKLGSNNGRKLAKSVSAQTAASYYRTTSCLSFFLVGWLMVEFRAHSLAWCGGLDLELANLIVPRVAL